jgi:CysZ protein
LLKDLIIAFASYIKAHQFIAKHKLWKWILIPGIIYTVLFFVVINLFSSTASDFIVWMTLKSGLKMWMDSLTNSFAGFLFVVGSTLVWFMILLFYFSLFKYLFLIVGAPLFAYLSEKTASILEEKEFPFVFKDFVQHALRGMYIAVRNSLWQTVYLLTILVICLIPILGWFTPFMALLIECYYLGFSMLDYSMERKNKTAQESIFFIGANKGLAIGNGIIFYMLHFIPIIGWVFAPCYAVIAATLSLDPKKQII